MSSGTVPVVNDIPPFRAVIAHRQNGFVTDFGDADRAADTLVEVLSLDQARLCEIGQCARESVAGYSWENVAIQLEQLYRRVLQARKRARNL